MLIPTLDATVGRSKTFEEARPPFRRHDHPRPSLIKQPSSMKDTDLHPAYFKVRFRGPWPDRIQPDEFAIITAYATTGENWPEERNRAADLELENELRETGSWMRRLTGYDPSTGHAEPGWAVEMGFEAACDLGLRFQQDAIFWISMNRFWVAKCGPDRRRTEIGPFDDRFEMKEVTK